MVLVLFLFNQLYGIMVRIKKRMLGMCFLRIFQLNFNNNKNQLFAASKLFIMHFQILLIVLQHEQKEFKSVMDNFKIVGNPQSGFSRDLECLINVQEDDSLQKKIGYYLSFYGFLFVLGSLVFLIICQAICYFFSKKII